MDEKILMFSQTVVFLQLCKNPNVLAILLNGSRSAGIENKNSDYDLICLTKEEQKIYNDQREVAQNLFNLHWFYRTIDSLTEKGCGGLWFGFLKPEMFLYISPDAEEIVARLLEKKEEIATLSFYNYYEYHQRFIDAFAASKYNKPKLNKVIASLCAIAMMHLKKDFDTNLLLKVKSNAINELTEEEYEYLKTLVKKCDQRLKTEPIDKEKVQLQLINYII